MVRSGRPERGAHLVRRHSELGIHVRVIHWGWKLGKHFDAGLPRIQNRLWSQRLRKEQAWEDRRALSLLHGEWNS